MKTRLTLAMVTPPRMPLRTLSEPLRPIVKKQIFNAVILVFRQNNRVAACAKPRPYLQPVRIVVRYFVKRDAGVVAGGEVAGGLDVARGKGFPLASRPRTVPANDAADFAGCEFDESFHEISKRKGHGRQMKKSARRFALCGGGFGKKRTGTAKGNKKPAGQKLAGMKKPPGGGRLGLFYSD